MHFGQAIHCFGRNVSSQRDLRVCETWSISKADHRGTALSERGPMGSSSGYHDYPGNDQDGISPTLWFTVSIIHDGVSWIPPSEGYGGHVSRGGNTVGLSLSSLLRARILYIV